MDEEMDVLVSQGNLGFGLYFQGSGGCWLPLGL